MKLRFWNRRKQEKKIPTFKVGGVLPKEYQIGHLRGVTNLGDLSNDDMLPSQREQDRLDMMEQDSEIFGRIRGIKADFIINDDPKENQCHGKLRSGKRCSRVVELMYCWQHKLK